MEDKGKDIEDLFRERFSSDEAPVSSKVWQSIQNTLPTLSIGILGFGKIKSIVLWSAVTMISVSVAVSSYLYIAKDDSVTLQVQAVQQQERLSINTENNSNVFSHAKNYVIDQKNLGKSSLDSMTCDDARLRESFRTIDTYNTKTANKENYKDVRKEIHFSNSYSSSEVRKIENGMTARGKSNEITHPNNSLVSYTGKSKKWRNNKDILSSNKVSASPTIDKQLALRPENFITTDKSTTELIASQNSKDITLSGQQTESLLTTNEKIELISSSNKNKLTPNADSSINLQGIQHYNSGNNNNNKNPIKHSDTLQNQSNTSIDLIDEENSKQKITDSLSSDKNQLNNSIEITSPNSLTKINSSSSNTTSSSITDSSKTFHTFPEPLKKEDQHDALSDISLNSSVLIADSLSSTILTSVTKADHALIILDSTQHTAKDSSLTNATTKKEKSKSKLLTHLSFDLLAAVLSTGAVTKATESFSQDAVDDKNQNDKNGIGYSAGVVINYKLSDRFHTSAGMLYNTFSEQYNFHYNLKTTQSVNIDSSWQNVVIDSINREIKAKDQYSFLSIPLQLSYTFWFKEKIRLSATAGMRSNIFLTGVTYLTNAAKSDVMEIKSGFHSISFSYLLSLEAAYQVREHIALLVQPTFVYGASSIHNKASGLNQKLYGLGVTVGLRFTF